MLQLNSSNACPKFAHIGSPGLSAAQTLFTDALTILWQDCSCMYFHIFILFSFLFICICILIFIFSFVCLCRLPKSSNAIAHRCPPTCNNAPTNSSSLWRCVFFLCQHESLIDITIFAMQHFANWRTSGRRGFWIIALILVCTRVAESYALEQLGGVYCNVYEPGFNSMWWDFVPVLSFRTAVLMWVYCNHV